MSGQVKMCNDWTGLSLVSVDEWAGLDIAWLDWIALGQCRWCWLVWIGRYMSGQVYISNGWTGLSLVSVDCVCWCGYLYR